jgi:hypothetical protein
MGIRLFPTPFSARGPRGARGSKFAVPPSLIADFNPITFTPPTQGALIFVIKIYY